LGLTQQNALIQRGVKALKGSGGCGRNWLSADAGRQRDLSGETAGAGQTKPAVEFESERVLQATVQEAK
jgi:hypothetical protein